MQGEQMAAHLEQEQRQGQRQTDPEPPCHINQFRIGPRHSAGHQRLQRHAADRAGTGTDLPHLRVHRAGVDGAGGNFFGLRRVSALQVRRIALEIVRRIGGKALAAARAAEMVFLAGVRRVMGRFERIDGHAADRIFHGLRAAVTVVFSLVSVGFRGHLPMANCLR